MAAPRSRVGLSLAGFTTVIDAAGGRAALESKSTEWLKQSLVKPATAAASIPYAALLRALPNGAELVGNATHFLSHAYSMPFLCSVDAAAAWAARNPRAGGAPHFFYFDLLVVNQHGQTMGVTPEILWEEFAGGVRSVGYVFFVRVLASELIPRVFLFNLTRFLAATRCSCSPTTTRCPSRAPGASRRL